MNCRLVLLALATALCLQVLNAAPTSESKSSDSQQASRSKMQGLPDEEQQLEKLKMQGKGVAVVKSQTQSVTNINGNVQSVSEKQQKVEDPLSGKTVAQISEKTTSRQGGAGAKPDSMTKTVVDVPNKGVHHTTLTHNGRVINDGSQEMSEVRRRTDSTDYYQPLEGIQYTPADMAEYIYRTGDEEGVTLAIEELMREGLMTQDDAISYLEEVKMDLEILRAQDERESRMREVAAHRAALAEEESQEERAMEEARIRAGAASRLAIKGQRLTSMESQSEEKRMSSGGRPYRNQDVTEKKRKQPTQRMESYRRKSSDNDAEDSKGIPSAEPDMDYEDMLERLRLADFLSKEFSLEEVIYQLAKQMFAQSVLKGNSDAEEALQRFTAFLQQESARGRISPDLQRKVIDVMLAALVDTVGEHPEFSALQPGPMIPNSSSRQSEETDLSKTNRQTPSSKQEILDGKSNKAEQLTEDKGVERQSLADKKTITKSAPLKNA